MWELKKEPGVPIYQAIVSLILNYIDTDQLLPGEKIPSERKLATYFQVNRTTVVHALDELVAMGVIVRKAGSGTRVNEGKWGVYRGSEIDWRRYLRKQRDSQGNSYAKKIQEKRQSSHVNKICDGYTPDVSVSLLPDFPFPEISWEKVLQLESSQRIGGLPSLRQKILDRFNERHHLTVNESQLMLTPGSQQALLLLVQVLLTAGEGLAIESPSSFYQLSMFQTAGIRVYDIPVDKEGMRLDLLEEKIKAHQIKLVLVNPSFQNPTGTTMSLKRREALIALCRKYQLPIIEDDVFGELSYEKKQALPLLKSLDPDNVIYISSFTKVLGPTAKIGWVIGPPQVLAKMLGIRSELDLSMSVLPQMVALNALENPNYDEEVRKLGQRLGGLMTRFITLIDEKLKGKVSYYIPQGGCYLWVTVHEVTLRGTDYDELIQKGCLVTPGYVLGQTAQSMRINVSRLSDRQAKDLITTINQLIQSKGSMPFDK